METTELTNTITKHMLEGSNSRLDKAEELISNLEVRVVKSIQTEQRKEEGRDGLRDLQHQGE